MDGCMKQSEQNQQWLDMMCDYEGTYSIRKTTVEPTNDCRDLLKANVKSDILIRFGFEIISIQPFRQKSVEPEVSQSRDMLENLVDHFDYSPLRREVNILYYRCMLFEIDDLSIEIQAKFWNHLIDTGFPISSIVYSGNSSLHVLFIFDAPITTNKEEFNLIYNIILAHLKFVFFEIVEQKELQWLNDPKEPFDLQCRNGTVSTRIPGVVRKSTRFIQELLFLGGKVNMKDVISRIDKEIIFKELCASKENKCYINNRATKFISKNTNKFLSTFGETGKRNSPLCKAIAQLANAGFTDDEIQELLQESADRNGQSGRYSESTLRSKMSTISRKIRTSANGD
jgi:hypothetical protein